MSVAKRIWNLFLDLFGFRRNSKYVNHYLNDANIRSSIYMTFIIIAIEIWMIVRNINKYVAPNWNNPANLKCSSNFDMLFTFIGLYILFIACSLAVLIFAITYQIKRDSKASFIINIVSGSICILWPLLLFFEHLSGATTVNVVTVIVVYASMPLLGIFIISHTLYYKKKRIKNYLLSIGVITCFALVCLAFGVKVGYSDYANPELVTKVVDGVETQVPNFTRLKMITCFFTMIIFVACLLIWKPYISIIILTAIFVGFMNMLKNYEGRTFIDGDEINYITFLISLTMITISIYQQRIAEAKKDELLIHEANYDHLIDINNVNYISNKIMYNHNEDPIQNVNKIFLFIDIFNFRTINLHRGFEEGDKFLIKIASAIKDTFAGDLIARQGDDHFVVFTDEESFMPKIEKLNNLVKESASGLYVLLKVGGYKPKYGEDTHKSIDRARYACNLLKKKNGLYMEYDENMNEFFHKRQYIINHLDEAIEKEWIVAYYQPVVWSKNHRLCGAEALARWIDPTYGFLSPADFIPVLEETRLIHKLDKAIIEFVCKNMRRAIDENKPIVPVSLNFSRLDFELMDVLAVLEDAISKYNIDKDYIHVEITESALTDNDGKLNESINVLRKNNYAIWLDDFGSGYSSLNVLKDFIFDVIKIDMRFLSNFENSEKTKDIIDCIIQLATRLGMKTLTEGVETEEQSKFLEDVGCGRLQGYLYGKPFNLEEFEEKIMSGKLKISKKIL